MRILCLLLLFILISCSEEVIKKPEDLIPPEKMTRILYDLAILDAAKNTNPSTLESYNIEVMDYVYKRHGIDSTRFINSDIYYASRPLEYEAIYKRVEFLLEQEKDSLENERKRVSDSIRIEAEKRREEEAMKKSDN